MIWILLLVFSCLLAGPVSAQKHTLFREDASIVNPLIFNNGALNDTTLSAAISNIAGSQRTLMLTPGTWTIANNLTIPSNILLWVTSGATVSINAGRTLTVNGRLLAERPSSAWATGSGTLSVSAQQIHIGAIETSSHFLDAGVFTDMFPPFVVSGCLHGTSVTTTSPALTCTAWTSSGVYANQTSTTVTYSGGDGTYWLLVYQDTTSTVSGWTREAGTHFLWQVSSTLPTTPTGGLILQRVTVSGSAITATLPFAYRSPIDAIMSQHRITSWGAVADGTYGSCASGTDNTTAINRAIAAGGIYGRTGIPTIIPMTGTGTFRFNTGLTFRHNASLSGPVPQRAAHSNFSGPVLQWCGGAAVALNLTGFDNTYLGQFVLSGDNTAASTGVLVGKERNSLENLTVEAFTGAGSYGIRALGSGGNEVDWAHWRNVWALSNQTGILIDGTPTNSNNLYDVRVSGNVGDGLRINGANALNVFGFDSEGNCTSGGACANLNIQAGTHLNFFGMYTEITTEDADTKNIILPVAGPTNNHIYLYGIADGNLGANFYTQKTHTYFSNAPRQLGSHEPARFTNLTVNRLSTFDPGQNTVQPILEQHPNGTLALGTQNITTPSLTMARVVSLANDAMTSLENVAGTEGGTVDGSIMVLTSGGMCLYMLDRQPATPVAREVLDVSGAAVACAAAQGTGSSTNIYWSTLNSRFEIENKTGGARTYAIHYLSN